MGPGLPILPHHPVADGAGPFALLDEWYFNMRWSAEAHADASLTGAFRSHPPGVTPILAAIPTG